VQLSWIANKLELFFIIIIIIRSSSSSSSSSGSSISVVEVMFNSYLIMCFHISPKVNSKINPCKEKNHKIKKKEGHLYKSIQFSSLLFMC
jgi:hypothetical protein